MTESIKDGIIVELEEILVEKLGKWIEHRRIEQTEKEDRKVTCTCKGS